MGIGSILAEAFRGYRQLFGQLVPLCAVALLLVSLALLALALTGIGGAWVLAAQGVIGMLWVQGLLVQAIDDVLAGAPAGIGARLARAASRLNAITFATLLVGLPGIAASVGLSVVPALGLIAFLCWLGVMLTVGALVIPVVAIEGTSALTAVRRSLTLVSGRAGTVAGTMLVTGVLVNAASVAGERALGAALGSSLAAELLGSMLVTALVLPFVATTLTVLYHELAQRDPAPAGRTTLHA